MAGSETKHRSVYRREGGDWLVELRLREVRQHSSEAARTLPESVAHYFDYRAQQTRVELGRLLRLALANLAIGLVFLAACLALRRQRRFYAIARMPVEIRL